MKQLDQEALVHISGLESVHGLKQIIALTESMRDPFHD